jgi:hypothetical protein
MQAQEEAPKIPEQPKPQLEASNQKHGLFRWNGRKIAGTLTVAAVFVLSIRIWEQQHIITAQSELLRTTMKYTMLGCPTTD